MSEKARCPVCLVSHSLDKGQQASVFRCKCGVALFFSGSGRLVATVEQAVPADIQDCPQELINKLETKPKLENKPKQADKDVQQTTGSVLSAERPKTKPKAAARKNKPWLAIAGIGLVVLLFVVSLILFLTRGDDVGHTATVAQGSNSVTGTAGKPQRLIIEPGTLKKLLAQSPSPPIAIEEALETTKLTNRQPAMADSGKTQSNESERSPYGGLTAKRSVELPNSTPPRPLIPVLEIAKLRADLAGAYAEAFESYEAFMGLDEDAPYSDEYKTTLGKTITLTRHAYELAIQEGDPQKSSEMCYLLAYLSFTAGHLMEASIYAEAAARMGDAKVNATQEAVMIGLAATQEAAATQWGNANELGELQQMATLAELFEDRWPDDPQQAMIWLSLGQLYDAFGQFVAATEAYLKILPKSENYAVAQYATGIAFWNLFIDEASEAVVDASALVSRLETAKKHLTVAANQLEKQEAAPTMQIASAKLTLAKIAVRLGEPQAAVRWLEQTKQPLIDSISINKDDDEKLVVSQEFLQSVYAVIGQAKQELNDLEGAEAAANAFAKITGKEPIDTNSKPSLGTIKDQVDKLLAENSVQQTDVTELEESIDGLLESDSEISVSNRLWLGESWAKLAGAAENAEVSKHCFKNAAAVYEEALKATDFPAQNLTAAQLRRVEFLRSSGELQQSLDAIVSILKKTPGSIDLQLQAAKSLQELAFAEESQLILRSAIIGPPRDDELSIESPIWGWVKLTANLHRLRYSGNGTERHSELLLESHFHLARARWLLAGITEDSSERETLLSAGKLQLTRLLGTALVNDDVAIEWRECYEKLLELHP